MNLKAIAAAATIAIAPAAAIANPLQQSAINYPEQMISECKAGFYAGAGQQGIATMQRAGVPVDTVFGEACNLYVHHLANGGTMEDAIGMMNMMAQYRVSGYMQ